MNNLSVMALRWKKNSCEVAALTYLQISETGTNTSARNLLASYKIAKRSAPVLARIKGEGKTVHLWGHVYQLAKGGGDIWSF